MFLVYAVIYAGFVAINVISPMTMEKTVLFGLNLAVVNPADNNMSGPLLAKSFGTFLFAVISAIAFAAVLGTVSGLIVAASGAVAASANLPSIIMLLFWKKTTAQGIVASIFVGTVAALGIILLSPSMFARYGLDPASAPLALENPGIVSIPLSFITLMVVSVMTQKGTQEKSAA